MTELNFLWLDIARGPCAVCGKEGRACSRCHVDFYCDKEHQRKHWPRHKAGCGVLELSASRLVATRDIPANTRVLREQAVVLFPRIDMTQDHVSA